MDSKVLGRPGQAPAQNPSDRLLPIVGPLIFGMLPSFGLIQAHYGLPLGLAFLAAAAFLIPLFTRMFLRSTWQPSPRMFAIFLTILFVGLTTWFVAMHPLISWDSDGRPRGSDRDDTLALMIHHALRGESPYTSKTFLDNPLSPFPGSAIFAFPFYLLGEVGYQDLFWWLVFSIRLAGWFDRKTAMFLLAYAFSSPAVLIDIASGSDIIENSLIVIVCGSLVFAARGFATFAVASLVLGLAVATRFNLIFSLPFLAGALPLSVHPSPFLSE